MDENPYQAPTSGGISKLKPRRIRWVDTALALSVFMATMFLLFLVAELMRRGF